MLVHSKKELLELLSNTVEHPCAATNPKHENFSSKFVTVGNSRKRPPRVIDRVHYLGAADRLMIFIFFLFLTYCKRPLDDVILLFYVGCSYTLLMRRTLVT